MTVPLPDVDAAARNLWDERDSLRDILDAAQARMMPPFTLLGNVACRVAHLIPVDIQLPALVGSPAGFGYIVASSARSGGGKSASARVAEEVVPQHVHTRGFGSVEGAVKAFYETRKSVDADGKTHTETTLREPAAIHFYADESDQLRELVKRQGNALLPFMRQGWSGSMYDNTYMTNSEVRTLEAHTYRFTAMLNIQPAHADWILADGKGGLLQRTLWTPGFDQYATDEHAHDDPLDPLKITDFVALRRHLRDQNRIGEGKAHLLSVPDSVAKLVRRNQVRNLRGLTDGIDGHLLLLQEKTAYILTFLDGRFDMTEEDWALAGALLEVSTLTREWVAAEAEAAADDEAREKGRRQGKARSAFESAKYVDDADRNTRIVNQMMRKLTREAMTEAALQRAVAPDDRGMVPKLIPVMVANGLIEAGPPNRLGHATWRPKTPA